MVLVVLENQRGNIHPFSLEAVAAGQKFAQELNCELSILCIGEKVDELRTQAQNFKSNKLVIAQNSMIDMYSAVQGSKSSMNSFFGFICAKITSNTLELI